MTVIASKGDRAKQGVDRDPIYFNMRFLTQPLSGMQRYAEELLFALDQQVSQTRNRNDVALVGLVPPGKMRHRDWKAIKIRRIGSLTGHAWEQWDLYLGSRGGKLVSLAGSGPLLHSRQILAVHDANLAINPQYYSPTYRVLHGILRPILIKKAVSLVTVSDFSLSELSSAYDVNRDRFHVIHDSAEHIITVPPDLSVLERNGLTKDSYVLCVGNLSPNKNIPLAIGAFRALRRTDIQLAVVGSNPRALAATQIPNEPWLRMLGRVTDGELRALYANAVAFVFPSVYEGFGVPPLEALTLGCPVVSSDSSAMPEILGDAVHFFKCGDVADCAERMQDALTLSPNEKYKMCEKGVARAALYSWKASAKKLAKVLEI
ncbi:MAG: glycosyltransferase family 1 protein [Pseudomonadota bacterium]